MSPDISGLPPSIPLTDEQMRLVKSTAPILKEHGPAITRRFYGDMLEAQPELKSVFNHSSQLTGHQAEALASAVYAYAEHIDNLGPIIPVVDRINQKHASLHIEPPQYAVVGQFLLQAITAVLGADVFAGALYDAWAAAYWQLAHVFIEREATLYAQAGWVGWKPFVVQKRVQESDDIVSFYLIPKEDAPKMGLYRPGQFISVRKFITELGVYQSRQYSLSDAPSPDHYRISVKRDRGVVATRAAGSGDLTVDPTASAHPGWLSNLLHDTLQEGADIDVAYPFGDFVLEPGTGPVVLLAAGVGATPLLAMLNALLADANSPRQVSWVQVARTPAALPFRVDIANAARAHPDRLRTALFYSHTVDEGESQTCVPGRLDIAKVDTSLLHLEDGAAEYYTCGPATFMRDMTRELAARGVDTGRVHAEVFGSGGLA